MTAVELREEQDEPEAPSISERAVAVGDRQATERQPEGVVLLIDSDPSSVEFMARALSQAGVEVLVTDRIAGPDGAAVMLQSKAGINVVVLDPQAVPGRDNLSELQTSGLRDDTQVILVAEPVTLARRRLSVTSLCLASKSPVTTALRRIERLLEAGLVSCTQDPKDRRRKYIELTALGTEKVQETLQAIAQRLRGEETTVS